VHLRRATATGIPLSEARPESPAMTERVRFFEDLRQIPSAPWRELTRGRPGLHLELIRILAGQQNDQKPLAAFVIEDDAGFAAAAVCSRIGTSAPRNELDSCLFGRGARIARATGSSTGPLFFFSQPMLASGSVVVRPGTGRAEARRVLGLLLDEIEATAAVHGCGIAFRGMTPDDDGPLIEELRDRRYLETEGPPTTRMEVQWQDVDGYLQHLRRRSRSAASKAKYELNKSRGGGVEIRRVPSEPGVARTLASIAIEHYRRKNGEDPGYSPDLFVQLATGLPDDFIIFEARRGERLLGMASMLRSGPVAWASWMGMLQDEARQDFTYFNLCYYHIAAAAPTLGIKRILYGTTAYAAKLQRGCEMVVNPVLYRPRALLTRLLARPYVRFHRQWYLRKFA